MPDLSRVRNLARTARLLSPPDGLRRFRASREVGPAFPDELAFYGRLSAHSAVLSRLSLNSGPAHLNLLLPEAAAARAYAGVKTALSFAAPLAAELELPLRVITVNAFGAPGDRLEASLDPSGSQTATTVIRAGDGEAVPASHDDLWVATHWTTAHALDVAARVGLIRPEQVVYLVQDYEPGFVPWSTDFALIRASYHAGFRIVVNSSPLADHLEAEEKISVPSDYVIAPHLPTDALRAAHARRTPGDRVNVFFYARPNKPRNLFAIGDAALRRACMLLGPDAARVTVFTAGEPHPPLELANGARCQPLGQTSWDAYFELLSEIHVGLSLMYSPHPSHPPLELAISGASCITNRFGLARDTLHPRICAVDADPDRLALALVDAIRGCDPKTVPDFVDLADPLGRPLDDVVRAVAAAVRTATP